jgi:hypothetical protein
MKTLLLSTAFALYILGGAAMADSARTAAAIKGDILALAELYEGQGDPDFAKQDRLDALVAELLAVAPQPPVRERLDLLHGVWKQVWGPYDYRGDDRGVDPSITVDEIYQVVFEGGYYYNVNPKADGTRVSLLRGEYAPVDGHPDMLRVRFTAFPANEGRPDDILIWKLAALAEKDALPNPTTVVPAIIVRLFFGGGYLREAYTDDDLRITYGGDHLEDRSDEYIYVMTRVAE